MRKKLALCIVLSAFSLFCASCGARAADPAAGDIYIRVESPYEARRVITDRDVQLSLVIGNISGVNYVADEAALEKKNGTRWESAQYRHANLGMINGYSTSQGNLIFLNGPLAVGDYRLRLTVSVLTTVRDGTRGSRAPFEPACEFTVTAYGEAQAPAWDASRLGISLYDEYVTPPSIPMSFSNPVLTNANPELGYSISANDIYYYDENYRADVLIDGTWYDVPFINRIVHAILLVYNPGDAGNGDRHECKPEPASGCGILPAGTYRIVKEFDLGGYRGSPQFIRTEYAVAEFRADETIELDSIYQPATFD